MFSPDELTVGDADLDSPEARALIAALNAELLTRYPDPEANHFDLVAAEVASDQGAFLVARLGGQPVGCGAVRRLDATTAEIKRMYVAPTARGLRIATRVLAELEARAAALGVVRLVLETGVRQPEALAVYRRVGFVEIPLFGEYVGSPHSVCMEKRLG